MTRVVLDQLCKTYSGAHGAAVSQLDLTLDSGTMTALLGPSGCGKTTTMKMIAGLLDPTGGDIRFDDRSILRDAPEARGAVMVFQDHLLFPYLTVAGNVGFGLKMRSVAPDEIAHRVGEMLEKVQLPGLGQRMPGALSGGQQRRVALARALIIKPDVLLLDEPLSNLDAHLRMDMRDLIRSLQAETGITTLVVTHDQEDAVVLADRVALMLDGQLRQVGPPRMFFRRPVDEATARFFGGRNFIPGTCRCGVFDCALGPLQLPQGARTGPGRVTFRPEALRLAASGNGRNTVRATVTEITYLGTQTRLRLMSNGTEVEALVPPTDADGLKHGAQTLIHLPVPALWVID
ncbi:MAG: ABC transporter ATP-binding protein [Rhodobacteraceae bacterium]|nr:ABC transporter ATP-binding protein [Paracoccaceae bacterium]